MERKTFEDKKSNKRPPYHREQNQKYKLRNYASYYG